MTNLSAVHRLYLVNDGERFELSSKASRNALATWVDLDLNQVENPAGQIEAQLVDLCKPEEADIEQIRAAAHDLSRLDPWPDVKTFGRIHKTSATYVLPPEPEERVEGRPLGEGLIACRVEIAVVANGLLSVWHPARPLPADPEARAALDIRLDEFRMDTARVVNSSVKEDSLRQAADLTIAVLSATVASFSPHRRDLHQSLDRWEQEYYKRHFAEDEPESARQGKPREGQELAAHDATRELAQVHTLGVLLSRELDYLTAPRERAARYWAGQNPTSEAGSHLAEALDEKVDRYRRSLRDTRDRVRAGLDLSHSVESARRDAEARIRDDEAKERDEAARKMDYFIAKLAAVFLAPTLVAGFYGINTSYPDAGTERGTVEAIVLMVVSAGAAWWAIGRLERGKSRSTDRG